MPESRVSRRQFLHLTAAAGAPAVFLRHRESAQAPVVVVGAGLAGLRAATVLRRAGRQVVVLEARDRPGGRVHTIRSPFDDGLFGEAGAIRIPGLHRTVLRAIREYNLRLVPFESTNGRPLDEGPARPAASAIRESELNADERRVSSRALLERYIGTLPDGMADPAVTPAAYARWAEYDRATWPAWLRQRGASPEAVRLITLGGDSSDLSALYMLRQFAMLRPSTQLYKIAGGMDLLPRAMAAALGAAIRYNAPVVSVSRSDASVAVSFETSGGVERVTASHVILAVPLSTLRQIEVRPRWSAARQRAIEAVPYYPGVRVLLQTRNRFWNRIGLNGTARTARAEVWDATYDHQAQVRGVLGVSCGGTAGQQLAAMEGDQRLAFAIDLVADALPGIRSAVERAVVQPWMLEPWSKGAFVAFKPGQMTTLLPDIVRAEGRVHFAGEHTSSWTGWMEGALESGERAARDILGS